MTKRKKINAQDLALSELLEFPNYVAWLVFTPEGKALAGASHAEKHRVYEAAVDDLLENLAKATGDLEAEPCDR